MIKKANYERRQTMKKILIIEDEKTIILLSHIIQQSYY